MLTGAKIILRPWSVEDVPALKALKNDVEIQTQLMGTPRPNSDNKILNWLEGRDKDNTIVFFIVASSHDNKAIGYIQLSNLDKFNLSGYLGICLAKKFWGKGIANEALNLLITYAVDVLNLRKIILLVKNDNSRAIGFYQKTGFDIVGVLKKHQLILGVWTDVVMMERIVRK